MFRPVLVFICSLLFVLGLSAPASASDSAIFHDPVDTPGPHIDITRIAVHNGSVVENRLIVRVTVGRLRFGDRSHLWVDTTPSPGPEYRMTVIPNSDGLWLDFMDGRWWGPEFRVECPGLRARSDASGGAADDPDHVRFSIPRSCMEFPGSVRISVRHKFTPVDGPLFDYAPARQRFSSLVT